MADEKTVSGVFDTSIVPETRLVLMGPAGNGKSATGNTILGRHAFEDRIRGTSLVNHCCHAKTNVDGQNVLVVDAPGLLCLADASEDRREEISSERAKCVLLSSPGPHAILLVIRMTRLSDRLPQIPRIIEDIFGVEAKRYIIIVLTGKDDLEYEEETLEDYIANAPSYMSNMFQKFPIFAINNRADSTNKMNQTKNLLKLVAERNRVHMTNSLFKSIEEILLRAEGESVV